MNELALFTGAGGSLLTSKLLGWRTICAVEIEKYNIELLLQRQEDGALDPFPIWDDVRTFNGRPFCGCVDVITAGFPCQPFSTAGPRWGAGDSKNMWPDTIRIAREVEPSYIFLENVSELLTSGYFPQVASDLVESGYSFRWRVLSAAEMGAPHHRNRLWIVAYASSVALEEKHMHGRGVSSGRTIQEETYRSSCKAWWSAAPGIPRVDDGVANRVDRIKSIGNGWVPGVARFAWQCLT